MVINLEDLCSVKQSDFEEIFDDFFVVRNINQNEISSHLDKSQIYNNYEIKKIEIKNWLDYNGFIDKLLLKLNSYYYDWNKNNDKDIIDFNEATKDLNQYTPKIWMLLDDFIDVEIWINKWSYYIEDKEWKILIKDSLKKDEKKELINYLETKQLLNIENINHDKKYIILWKNNKIYFPTSKQILWYLHGDIGEFILFFLVEWYLKKPVLFSKVQHCKSSPWDKVKWSDWIHISYEDWKPKFIFLESKFRNNFWACVDETIESQEEFLINQWEWDINNEIRILYKNNLIVSWLWYYKTLFENWFFNFINPYWRKEINWNDLHFDLVSWIIYELWDYNTDYNQTETIDRINYTLKKYKNIEKLLNNKKVTIFLFPLISDVELIKTFLNKIKH